MDYTVSGLLELAKRSEEYRDRYLKSRAIRNIQWYNGEYENYTNTNYAPIQGNVDYSALYYVNLVYSTSRTIVSSIYNKFPEFSFFLQGDLTKSILETYGLDIKFQSGKLQKTLEAITKIYFKEMHAQRTNRKVVLDATIMGFGCSKQGYNVDFDTEKKKLFEQNYNIPKDKQVESASNIEVSELVRRSEPWLLRVHPLNMLFPISAEDFYRLPWHMEIIYKNKDETEAMYGVPGKLSSGYMPEYLDPQKPNKERADMVKLYEFHSLDPAFPFICVFSEGYDKFLEKKQHPLYNEETGYIKDMYKFVWFNESYKSIYPQSDIDLVQSQIREAIFQTQKRVEHVRKWVSMLFLKGVFEEKEKLKIVSGADGTYIESLDGNASAEVLAQGDLSNDFYNNIISIRNEIFETLGLTDYAVGGATEKRKATEAQLIERSRIDRVQERVDIIETFSHEQIDTFVEIMKEYEQVGRMFNIELGNERLAMFFAGELLQMSDMSTKVVPGSTVSLDRDAEIRQLEKVAPILMNANQMQPGLVKMGKYFKDLLNKLGYSGDEYINEQAPMLPPNVLGNVGQPPGQGNQPNQPVATPQQLGVMPTIAGGG